MSDKDIKKLTVSEEPFDGTLFDRVKNMKRNLTATTTESGNNKDASNASDDNEETLSENYEKENASFRYDLGKITDNVDASPVPDDHEETKSKKYEKRNASFRYDLGTNVASPVSIEDKRKAFRYSARESMTGKVAIAHYFKEDKISCITKLLLPNCVIDRKVRKSIEHSGLSMRSKGILGEISDSAVISATLAVPHKIIDENKKPPECSEVQTKDIDLGWIKCGKNFDEWKPTSVDQTKTKISSSFISVVLREDDNFTKFTCKEKIIGGLARNRFFLPIEDHDTILDDDETEVLLRDLMLEEGVALPTSYNTDFNMETDESFCRIFFYGMGSVLLTKQEKVSESELGPFLIDMPYHKLKTRSLYRPYGARIHFSIDQKVTGIYDYGKKKLFQPGDDGWDAAKMLAKVTAFLVVTVQEHLSWTHLICSNDATREMTLNLPPHHPIRRLLTVFTFRSNEININAFDVFVLRSSLFHRGSGLKYSSVQDLFEMAFKTCNVYEPFSKRKYIPAVQKLADEGKLPYVSEGAEYDEIVRSFVRNWLKHSGDAASDDHAKAFYDAMKKSTKGHMYRLPDWSTEDAMVDLLTAIIFTVTAFHELVGNVVDFTALPTRSGIRLSKRDPTRIDLQSFLVTALISASTSLRMPSLMSTFANFFGVGGAPSWEIDVWQQFQDDLAEQSKKVNEDDKSRPVEFKFFDPANFECSVSV